MEKNEEKKEEELKRIENLKKVVKEYYSNSKNKIKEELGEKSNNLNRKLLKTFYSPFDLSLKFSLITIFFNKKKNSTKFFFSNKNYVRSDIETNSYYIKICPAGKASGEDIINIDGLEYNGIIFLTFFEYKRIED